MAETDEKTGEGWPLLQRSGAEARWTAKEW